MSTGKPGRDGTDVVRPSEAGGSAACLVHRPLLWLTIPVEYVLSRRGLVAAHLAFAAVLATSAWLRPPLRPDVDGLRLSLGFLSSPDGHPRGTVGGGLYRIPTDIPTDSVGGWLVGLIAAGVVISLWNPRRFGTVSGLLLAASLAACAAAVLNHPALIESFDGEYKERLRIASVLSDGPGPRAVTHPENGRVRNLVGHSGDAVRGWSYLAYGPWLVFWSAAGVLLGGRGRLRRRTASLVLWTLAGFGVATAVCWPRIVGEVHWLRATRLEAEGAYGAARDALERSVNVFPKLGRLERTRLLKGRLDHHGGLATPDELLFRAAQLARAWKTVRGARTKHAWEFDTAAGADRDRNERETATDANPSSAVAATTPSLPGELLEAISLLEEAKAATGGRDPVVRRGLAEALTSAGLEYARQAQRRKEGDDEILADRYLAAGRDAWRRAAEADPSRRDCAFLLGLSFAGSDEDSPERARAILEPLAAGVSDPLIRADVFAILGAADFRAGRFAEARRRYAESFDTLNLPQRKNHRAQRGLGGL